MRLPLARILVPAALASLLAGGSLAVPPATAAAAAAPAAPAAPAAAKKAPARQIKYHQWDSAAELARGAAAGVASSDGTVRFVRATARRKVGTTSYETAKWESPWVTPGFDFTQLIPSWSAGTPTDTWVEVRVRGRNAAGATTGWDLMARWALWDTYTKRTSVSGQSGDGTTVDVDTWTASAGLRSYQLRVVLGRKAGTTARPYVDTVGAMTSRLPSSAPTTTSAPGVARGVVLDVPRYSQMTHRGHFPQWGNGGQAWCSPTSTSMVLGYYGALPRAASYNWVPGSHTDPWVDYAARMTYDHAYRGTGNWSFNAAYAAPLAGKAFVTRLRGLREAEKFIKAGIPLVASVSFSRGQLDGAPVSSTNGHLLVIVGFTQNGDVVVNDPASTTREGVRRVYRRAQLEKVWLQKSGGLVYVIRNAARALPAGSAGNW